MTAKDPQPEPTDNPPSSGLKSIPIGSCNSKLTPSESSSTKISASDWCVGIGLMVMSAILFSFNGVLIKWASDIGYQSMEIFVFRSFMQLMITILATLFAWDSKSMFKIKISLQKFKLFQTIEPKLIKWIICRGIFAGIAGICYFHAISIIPLGDAITVFSIYPIFTAFIAFFWLKEKVSIVHCIALIAAVVGVYLIATGSTQKQEETLHTSLFKLYFGYIASAVGALTGGFVFVFIRLSTKRTKPIILVYSHGFFCLLLAFLVGIIFQGFNWYSDRTSDTIIIAIGFGLVGYFGQWTMNKSTQLIPAAVSSLIRSSDSVFSYIWEVVLFSTIPTTETIIGAVCVIIGIFLVSLEKLRKAYYMYQNDKLPEKQQLNTNASIQQKRQILIRHYGSTNTTPETTNSHSKTPILDLMDDSAFSLNLDPNDSHICLLAKQDKY